MNNKETLQYDPNILYPPIVIEKSEKETTTNNDAVEINDIRETLLNSKVYHFQITKKVKLKINRFYIISKNRTIFVIMC